MTATRIYHSPRRAAQAVATREAIVSAASALFAQRGYAGTTMRAVAEQAQVAVESVYATGCKSGLLRMALQQALSSDGAPLTAAPELRSLLDCASQREQIRALATFTAGLMSRIAPLEQAFSTAAECDAELRGLWSELLGHRLADARTVVAAIAANGPLRDGMTPELGAQTIWAIINAGTWQLTTGNLGWSPAAFADWLNLILAAALLPDALFGSPGHPAPSVAATSRPPATTAATRPSRAAGKAPEAEPSPSRAHKAVEA
jgi:AcrR family transcriptional regulator